jgi:hypothetical protein
MAGRLFIFYSMKISTFLASVSQAFEIASPMTVANDRYELRPKWLSTFKEISNVKPFHRPWSILEVSCETNGTCVWSPVRLCGGAAILTPQPEQLWKQSRAPKI